MKKRVIIRKQEVEKLLEEGCGKEEIRKELYPSLNKSQWASALKKMNLSSVRAKKIDFIIDDDIVDVNFSLSDEDVEDAKY